MRFESILLASIVFVSAVDGGYGYGIVGAEELLGVCISPITIN